MATLKKSYSFRLKPNQEQLNLLAQQGGARRFIWNWMLDYRTEYYKEHKKSLSEKDLSKELTKLKKQKEYEWLKDIDSQLPQQAQKDQKLAFKAFFEKRAGFPRFRSKKRDRDKFRIPQRIKVRSSRNGNPKEAEIYCPKVGWIPFILTHDLNEFKSLIKSATFKKTPVGNWYVTMPVSFEMPDVPLKTPKGKKTVAMDLGCRRAATLSNGEIIEAQRLYRKGEKKIRKASKAFSRTKKDSANREKARVKLAKAHEKVAHQRKDFIHKFTTRLIKDFDCVIIEDLNTQGMAKTKLAKSVLDAAFGEVKRQLEYKAEWNHKHLVKVDRWFPSSKTCSKCLHYHKGLRFEEHWVCPGCNTHHQRDDNASRMLLIEGLRLLVAEGHPETLNGLGAGVRRRTSSHLAMKEQKHPTL